MKFIFIILLVFSVHLNAQQNEKTHILTYRAETALDTSNFKRHKDHLGLILNEIKEIEIILKVQDTVTSFMVDLPMAINKKDRYLKKRARSYLLLREGYYNDLKNDNAYTYSIFNNEPYLIKSSLSKYKWELLDEAKIISGYTCYKAIAEKKYFSNGQPKTYYVTAWYSPKVPIKGAPKDYYGLPGLVFELSEDNFITFKLKSFESVLQPERPIALPKLNSISPEEYQEIVSKAYTLLMHNKV